MFDFLGHRAGKTGKSKRGNSPVIEPLEMRRLLSSDVTVDLQIDQATATYGDEVTFAANVTSIDGPVSGIVSFVDANSGGTLGQSDLVSGSATFSLSALHAGDYLVMARYEGDATFNPGDSAQSALTIDRAATTTVLSATGPATILLAVTSGAGRPDGGAVSLLEGSEVMGSGALAAGSFSFDANFSVGAHTLVGQFDGNGDYLPSTSDSVEFIVKVPTAVLLQSSASSIVFGQSVTLTASISGGDATGQTVDFRDGTLPLGSAVIDPNGNAVLNVPAFNASHHVITAEYGGDALLLGSISGQIGVNVAKAATSVGLIRSATWIPKGQWVLWRATVDAGGIASSHISGKVTFRDGTKVLAAVGVSNGVASFKSRGLAVGDHLLTASYAGNGNLKSSSAKAVKTTVVTSTRIDLMVMYTPRIVSDYGGVAELVAQINDAVWGTNTALWNSRIPVVVKLVHSALVNYAESGRMTIDLKRLAGTNDGYMDNVHVLRNTYKADVVSLFEHEKDEGGLGYVLADVNMAGNSNYAFNVVRAAQASGPTYTLAHELGHNLGAAHDREHSDGPGATSYAYGWRFTADGVQYHDIMAYDPGQTIPYFSNPRVKYRGVPTGTATADLARTFTFTAPHVARYR